MISLNGPSSQGRKDWVFRPLKVLSRVIFAPFFAMETNGLPNLPGNSAFILLVKHQCWQDIPLLAMATPLPLYYVAKAELFENLAGGWLMKSLGGIPLNRKRPLESRRSLQATIDVLNAGEGVVVFPEGTYYPNCMGPGHVGVVRFVLARLSLPFVPVGIRYTAGGRRTRVSIRYGRPLMSRQTESADEFLAAMMQEIARLSGMQAYSESARTSLNPATRRP